MLPLVTHEMQRRARTQQHTPAPQSKSHLNQHTPERSSQTKLSGQTKSETEEKKNRGTIPIHPDARQNGKKEMNASVAAAAVSSSSASVLALFSTFTSSSPTTKCCHHLIFQCSKKPPTNASLPQHRPNKFLSRGNSSLILLSSSYSRLRNIYIPVTKGPSLSSQSSL